MADRPTVQGTPEVILACGDCGEVGPIAGTRFLDRGRPDDPLCPECFAVRARVWHGTEEERRLSLLGPASDTDDDGTLWVRRTCPRCGGAGRLRGYEGTCFGCYGRRWSYVSPRGVQRAARWSATFQANRTPREAPRT